MNGWTQQQHVEMQKLHQSMVTLAQIEQQVGRAAGGFANVKTGTFSIYHWLINILNGLEEAWLCGTRRYSTVGTAVTGHGCGEQDAATRTRGMFAHIDAAFGPPVSGQRDKLIAALRAQHLGAQADQIVSLPVDGMVRDETLYGKAETFGRTVIGPHGSLEDSVTNMQIAVNYMLEFGYEGLARILGHPDIPAIPERLKTVVETQGIILEHLFRVSAMDFGITLPDDEAIIRSDMPFGPLNRGFDFFRVILEAERLGGRPEFPTVNTARTTKMGAGNFYQTLIDHTMLWQREIGSLDPLFFGAIAKATQSWVKVDNWFVSAVSSFPFTIPAPPGGGTPPPPPPPVEVPTLPDRFTATLGTTTAEYVKA